MRGKVSSRATALRFHPWFSKDSTMIASDLQKFLDERNGWTRKRLGHELEVSQDRLRRWLSGSQPIPRHIALACAAIVYGAPEWPWSAK
jgi:hypothetical protein